MGILDFFRRNKKENNVTVISSQASPEQTLFADNVLKIITPTVEQFGFIKHRVEIDEHSSTIIFRKDMLYIKISSSTYPTDYPFFYNIILGKGDSENFSECDWNSIALWLLKSKIDMTAKAKEYEFPFGDKVKFSIVNANEELLKYSSTFLNEDLTLFNETLFEKNKKREPYKIYSPDKDGKYKVTEEPTSIEQKKKYT